VTFCKGGCIGGPCVNSKRPILFRKRKVLKYMKRALNEDIPENKKGLIKKMITNPKEQIKSECESW